MHTLTGVRRSLQALLLCVLALTAHAAEQPTVPVERLHAVLLDVMRGATELGFAGRLERIGPVIEDSFDLPYVSRLIVRKSWTDLGEGQRARMRDLFGRLTIATYARRFDGYSGQSFAITGEREVRGGRKLVSTELRTPDEAPVRIDYVLHERDAHWRIVNVIADGVSELALKRSEYATIIKGQGFDALLEQIEEQVDELETEARA